MPGRPNILFFMCDQLTPLVLSPYQKGMAMTPTYQKIADEGVTFTSAYCNSPLCTPSRASMMSGQYGSKIGVYDNASVLHVDTPCFTHYLREAGYHTVLSGKMHFIGPDQLHGFSERLTSDIYPADIEWIPDWSIEKTRSDTKATRPRHTPVGVYQSTAPLNGNKFQAYDQRATFCAIQWLEHYARSSARRQDPFFLCVSLTNPHAPYVADQELWDLYENRRIPKPRVGPRPPDNANERWLQQSLTLDDKFVPPRETQLARRGYFACTTFTDQQLAKIAHSLGSLGLADDTWIILTSDHGDMIGERGLWYKKLFYESSARVPLIIRPPGGMAAQSRNQVVSLIDILPTLAEIGKTRPVDDALPGRSLLPVINDSKALADGYCIMEYMGESVLGSMRMVRQGAYKYVSIHPANDHEELLYNIDQDPDELDNLVDDPIHVNARNYLRNICTADGYDGWKINQMVRIDQQRRLFIRAALRTRPARSFSYQPPPIDPTNPEIFGNQLGDPRRPVK